MIVVFDLDYTLTQRGTWGRFVWRTVRSRPWLWLPLLIETARDQLAYKRGLRPRGAVKQSMMRWSLKHRRRDELERMAEEFAAEEVANKLRPGGLAALQCHRSRGHTVIIASAAVDLVVEPIARRLGIDHIVCTELEWDGQRLTGEFAGENCYGVGKRDRLQGYLAAKGMNQEPSLFYTDSCADFPVSDIANSTIVINPKPKTLAQAAARGFPVQCWAKGADGFEQTLAADVAPH